MNRVPSNFRYTEEQGKKLHAPRAKKGSVAGASPSAKKVAALFMRREEKLNKEQKKEYLDRLCASDTALANVRLLTQEFAKMVRGLEGEKLNGWLAEASTSEAELPRSGRGRRVVRGVAVRRSETGKDHRRQHKVP